MAVRMSEKIAPSFYPVHKKLHDKQYTHYWLKGGRGSTKSSFVSIEIINGIMQDKNANAVAIRKVGVYLKDSVYEQLVWAIEQLGVSHLWKQKLSPLELVYKPTGQKILFRGADKPQKLKSTKVSRGYLKYIWYEETAEFNGIEEIRNINQSLMRGGSDFVVFYSYNPPKSQRNWVNKYILEIDKKHNYKHHSSYLDVPPDWLGEQFIEEAESLKERNLDAYNHEYLGEVTGTGGEVFANVDIVSLSDEHISTFDQIREGIDFGYAADPFVYVKCHYDKKRKTLYIFDEIYKVGMSNQSAAERIKTKKNTQNQIIADSAEPKSIAGMKRYGLRITGAKKGPDSVNYGIKFLQSLDKIIIDNIRCPKTAEEFLNYELEPDGNDGFKDEFPDKNNHTIDAVRYALENDTKNKTAKIRSRKELY